MDFNFMPEYFLLPDEIHEFEDHLKEKNFQGEDVTYIFKPSKGKQGKGIRLVK